MKTRRYASLVLALALIVALFGLSQSRADEQTAGNLAFSKAKLDLIEANLVVALESNCPCLQASAAQVIRDVKAKAPEHNFSRSIIPLMRILKDEKAEVRVRQVAALTLHEIQSTRGDYAIQREAMFSDQPQLKRLCWWLTYDRVNGGVAETPQVAVDSTRLSAAR